MKKEIEQLLVFLIPAIVIEKLLKTISSRAISDFIQNKNEALPSLIEQFPSYSPGQIFTLVNSINVFIGLLPIVVIAVWLWRIEKAQNGRPVLWSLAGLVLNYWVLLLFIGHRLYGNRNNAQPKA
jgi:hypothetical protein